MGTTSGNAPRLRKRELFAALGYVPHEGQVRVHRSTAPRRIVCAGSRWGKTMCAAYEAVAAVLEPREEAVGWIVSPTYQLSSRIFDQVVAAIEREMPRRVIERNEREHILRVRNFGGGVSELRGKSADQPANLLGAALDFAILDEAATMKGSIWESHVSARLVDREGWALFISTPRPCPWLRKLHTRGMSGRDPHYEGWSAPSWENPFVSREIIELERGRMSEDAFAEEYLGEFTGIDDSPCDACGWPDPFAKCVQIVESKGYEFPACVNCGRYVDEKGHTIMGKDCFGRAHIERILLLPRDEVVRIPGSDDVALPVRP